MSDLRPLYKDDRAPIWPMTYTHCISEFEWEHMAQDAGFREHVNTALVERLIHELGKANIAGRRSDIHITVKDRGRSSFPHLAVEITATWKGGRDEQGCYRADFHGGPFDGRTMRTEATKNMIITEATVSGRIAYQLEGIDPVDGHLVYRYAGAAR